MNTRDTRPRVHGRQKITPPGHPGARARAPIQRRRRHLRAPRNAKTSEKSRATRMDEDLCRSCTLGALILTRQFRPSNEGSRPNAHTKLGRADFKPKLRLWPKTTIICDRRPLRCHHFHRRRPSDDAHRLTVFGLCQGKYSYRVSSQGLILLQPTRTRHTRPTRICRR